MADLPGSERVTTLVEQASDALHIRAKLIEKGLDTTDVDETIETIYRDLGRALHEAHRPDLHLPPDETTPPALELKGAIAEVDLQAIEDTESGPEATDTGSVHWHTDEAVSSGRFFLDEDLDEANFAPLPERDDDSEHQDRMLDITPVRISMADIAETTQTQGEPLWELANGTPAWAERVNDLIERVIAPPGAGLQEVSIRIQWACSDVGVRVEGLPVPVQLAILGWLGARAQALREHLEDDIGQRLALDRLRRFRVDADLPTVAPLDSMADPETGSWTDDADAWLAILAPLGDPT